MVTELCPRALLTLADVHVGFEQLHAEGVAQHVAGSIHSRRFEYVPVHLVKGAHRAFGRGLTANENA